MYVIEVRKKGIEIAAAYIHHDAQSGGYPYWSSNMYTAARFKTFEEARNEYQRMITAPVVKMSDNSLDLPGLLRSAGGINGIAVTDATVVTSIFELTGCTWDTLNVERLVQHTLVLHEDKHNASIQIVDNEGQDGA